MVSASNSSVINKMLEMDLNDEIATKNVIELITNHPRRSSFFLGNLLGTPTHQNTELIKTLFFYHDAYTPDHLYAFIFGKKGGPYFLVNIVEKCSDDGIPFEYYGLECRLEDIPIPPVQYKEIEELVRVDVSSGTSFTIRHITASEVPTTADGRFFTVPRIDVNDVIMSLHRREEGYKAIEELTNLYNFDEDADDVEDHESLDTFENKILNYVHQLQKNIPNAGDLTAFAKGMLLGVNVTHPYEEHEHGQNILAIQSPVDGTLFMIAYDVISVETRGEKNFALGSNMHNLLAHYVPDYAFEAKRRDDVILLAITYNVEVEPQFDTIDTIVSLRCSTKSAKDFKDVVEHYLLGISLMDRCRYVILKNKRLLTSITDLPQTLQSFIRSSHRSEELIQYRLKI